MRTLGVSIACGVLWLALSGYLEKPLLLGLGVASCALVVALVRRLGTIDSDLPTPRMVLRTLLYMPWLIKQIALANRDVIRLILSREMPVSPRMIDVHVSQRSDVARVIYANSITLTPGTVSVRVHDDIIEVHALTHAAAEGLLAGEMDYRVRRLEDV